MKADLGSMMKVSGLRTTADYCSKQKVAIAALLIVVVFSCSAFFCLTWLKNVAVRDATTICVSRPRWYEQTSKEFCHTSRQQLDQRLELLSDISAALNQSGITHWLCYGTLWGVIRGNRLLDYDKDGDICTFNATTDAVEQTMASLPGQIFYTRNFTSFHVWRGLGEVELTLFIPTNEPDVYSEDQQVTRLGWDSYFVALNCTVESFPQRLIEQPLPYKALDGQIFPVPREGFEIQMYMYPNDWHLITLPVGCS